MNQMWYNNLLGSAKCSTCLYSNYCSHGCFGAQFESTGDLFYPCETVCNMYKARVIFLYHKYKKLGMFDEYHFNREDKILSLIHSIEETEEYKKWTEVALKII